MDYLERAKLFGHDIKALENGEIITSKIRVKSLEDFKNIFSESMRDEQRKNFSKSANNMNAEVGSKKKWAPSMFNLMHSVYGTKSLTKDDTHYAEKLFPVDIEVTSGKNVTINTDIVKGPNASPYVISANNLIFDGGSVTTISTSLTIQAKNLIIKSGGVKPYHVGVLGNKGADGKAGTPGKNYSEPAKNGTNASAPTPGICTGASSGGDGVDGSKGKVGNPGNPASLGDPNMPATITIDAYDTSNIAPFVVFTQSGAGGNGGNGGQGGQGQNGGNGGAGCDTGCEGTSGGNGGKAGEGGDGGDGGPGSNGVAGYDISITFPNVNKSKLQTIPKPAPFGNGGDVGLGGPPGNYGALGKGGKHKSDGQHGGGNGSGGSGKNKGADGTKQGAPGNFRIVYS